MMASLSRKGTALAVHALSTTSTASAPWSTSRFTVLVGSSKDLIPSRRSMSTSSPVSNHPRTRPTPEQLRAQAKKVERKQAVRQASALKAKARAENDRLLKQRKAQEIQQKLDAATELTEGLPPFTEEDLQGMYQGLLLAKPAELALPRVALPPTVSRALLPDPAGPTSEGRLARMQALRERLDKLSLEWKNNQRGQTELVDEASPTAALAERLRAYTPSAEGNEPTPAETIEPGHVSSGSEGLQLLEKIKAASGASDLDASLPSVPLGVVVRSEWRDVLLDCAQAGESDSVLEGLDLMQKTLPITDGGLVTEIMSLYADLGRSRDALDLARYAREKEFPLSVAAHHHLMLSILPSHPDLALRHLYSLEAAGQTPLLETYTAVIRALVSPSSPSHFTSRGWDLYGHTRLVSHPTPSPDLFATMIDACSHGAHPTPIRALDLFTEMTDDNGLAPTEAAYTGLIRAHTRSGAPEDYFEALRFLRQMLDANVRPSRGTFHAILEGALRQGDLARARWVLVKMVDAGGDVGPDANTLALVFRAYARFKPSIRRKGDLPVQSVALTDPLGVPVAAADRETAREVDDPELNEVIAFEGDEALSYPGPMPSTADEVMAEARSLMIQCLGAAALDPSSSGDSLPTSESSTAFPDLRPTPFLLNTYFSVMASQAPFDHTFANFFTTVYASLGVPKNKFTFEIAMRRCETAKNRDAAMAFARTVFGEWRAWLQDTAAQASGTGGVEDGSGVHEALSKAWGGHISSMWAGMIRVLARNYLESEALALLSAFIAQYPPSDLRASVAATRAAEALLPKQPSPVRLSSPLYPETSPPVDLPPYILFADIKLLHQRLAEVEDSQGMKTVKAICEAYNGALWRAKEAEAGKSARRRQVTGPARAKVRARV